MNWQKANMRLAGEGLIRKPWSMRQFTEGVDAHLRTLRFRIFSLVNEAGQEAENVHLAGLCDDAEDAAILLI